MNVMHNIARKT